MSDDVKYVRHRVENDCVIACLAMITGEDYEDAFKGVEAQWHLRGAHEGMEAWSAYLAARGYALQDISHDYEPEDRLIEPWPLAPFAPIHLCFVYDQGEHATVMLADGRILDPNDPMITRLDQYRRVYRMVGVWKVRTPMGFLHAGAGHTLVDQGGDLSRD